MAWQLAAQMTQPAVISNSSFQRIACHRQISILSLTAAKYTVATKSPQQSYHGIANTTPQHPVL
jgi:hypothetical protein